MVRHTQRKRGRKRERERDSAAPLCELWVGEIFADSRDSVKSSSRGWRDVNRNFTLMSRGDSSSHCGLKNFTDCAHVYTKRGGKGDTFYAGTTMEKAGVALERFVDRRPLCSHSIRSSMWKCIYKKLGWIEKRHGGKCTKEFSNKFQYLEEGLVGRQRCWNLDRVKLCLELGSMIVNVCHLDDDSRSRWQRRPTVVPYCHLKARNHKSQRETTQYISRYTCYLQDRKIPRLIQKDIT